MARTHEVSLAVGDDRVELRTWDEVSLTQDMLSPVTPWTLTLWRSGQGKGWVTVRAAALLYAPMTLSVDGAVQLHGMVERIRDGANRSGAPVTLAGRDDLAALVESDVDPRLNLRNATLEEVIERAVEPTGLGLIVGAEASMVREIQAGTRPGARLSAATSARRTRRRHRVDRFKPRPGQTILDFVQGLCRRHGYLFWGGPYGDKTGLIIDRPDYNARPQGTLWRREQRDGTVAGNILEGFLDLNATGVATEVLVAGHTRVTAPQDAHHQVQMVNHRLRIYAGGNGALERPYGLTFDYALPSLSWQGYQRPAEATDATAPASNAVRTRTMETIRNEALLGWARVAPRVPVRRRYLRDRRARTPQIAEQRARHQLAKSMANFAVFEATVQGWGYGANGPLWTVNSMVEIDDEIAGVKGVWLITRVEFKRSRAGGHTASLRLVPPGAIDLEPDTEV